MKFIYSKIVVFFLILLIAYEACAVKNPQTPQRARDRFNPKSVNQVKQWAKTFVTPPRKKKGKARREFFKSILDKQKEEESEGRPVTPEEEGGARCRRYFGDRGTPMELVPINDIIEWMKRARNAVRIGSVGRIVEDEVIQILGLLNNNLGAESFSYQTQVTGKNGQLLNKTTRPDSLTESAVVEIKYFSDRRVDRVFNQTPQFKAEYNLAKDTDPRYYPNGGKLVVIIASNDSTTLQETRPTVPAADKATFYYFDRTGKWYKWDGSWKQVELEDVKKDINP